MIMLRCPYCNEIRGEDELRHGGEAGNLRPTDPAAASDEAWTDYLYMRSNAKGPLQEQWCCEAGCGQWFLVTRDTVSHQVLDIRRHAVPSRGEHAS